jgi:hypothetical protein
MRILFLFTLLFGAGIVPARLPGLSGRLTCTAQELTGPETVRPGTLAVFEIDPPVMADWTITSVESTEKIFQTDTSTHRLYFAASQPGTYHIVAAVVGRTGLPRLLVKTIVNAADDEVRPLPPVPDRPLAEWIKTRLPLLVTGKNREQEKQLVASCFSETVQKIEDGTIKTAQNARSQLQIALTRSLAFASDTAIDDWHDFLTRLGRQMATEAGGNVNDLDTVKNVFKTAAGALSGSELKNETNATPHSAFQTPDDGAGDHPARQQQSTQRTFRPARPACRQTGPAGGLFR